MSFLPKKDDLHGAKTDLSTLINKLESISDRDATRRMEIPIKRFDNASIKGSDAMDMTTGDTDSGQTVDDTTQHDKNVAPKVIPLNTLSYSIIYE